MVSAIMSVQPDATETYIFRLVKLTGPSLIPTQLAETFVVSANGDVVAVGMNKPATLAAGEKCVLKFKTRPTTRRRSFSPLGFCRL